MDRKGKQRGNPESWNGKDVLSNLADNTVWQEAGSSLPNHLEENHQPTAGSSDTGDLSPFDRHETRFVAGSEVSPPSSSLYGSDTATSPSGYSLQVSGLNRNLDGFSLNDADVSGSVNPQQPSTYEAQNPRPTPSTLGWPPGSGNVELYKLIFRSMDDMWLELKNKANLSAIIPWKVFLENPGSTSKDKSFICPWPGKCDRKEPFGRLADLERHLKHVHGPRPDQFPCAYNPCLNDRHLTGNAFTRKDHLRDHLRDFHQEDIGVAKGEKNARTKQEKEKWEKQQQKWLETRNIRPDSWCCAKCLVRISVARNGWHCTECNQPEDGPANENVKTRKKRSWPG